jgi:hypothetical protein
LQGLAPDTPMPSGLSDKKQTLGFAINFVGLAIYYIFDKK